MFCLTLGSLSVKNKERFGRKTLKGECLVTTIHDSFYYMSCIGMKGLLKCLKKRERLWRSIANSEMILSSIMYIFNVCADCKQNLSCTFYRKVDSYERRNLHTIRYARLMKK